jgi:2,3-dihydroxybenzoate-AMP ligase
MPARQEWPEEFAARYRGRGYWRGETFGAILRARADAAAGRTAVVGGDVRWTYQELDRRADALAAGFLALGFLPGERIVVQLPNIAEFISVVFALFRARIVPVFALPAHRRTEIVHFAQTAEAVGYIIPDSFGGFDYRQLAREVCVAVPGVRQVVVVGDADGFVPLAEVEGERPAGDLPSPSPSDVVFMQLSGGSTGVSKLIPRTSDDYIYSFRESARICGLSERSVYLGVLPIAHNFPMSSPGFFGTLYAGGTVVLSPSPAPDVAFPLITRERVTITALVPPLALVWLDAAATMRPDLSSLAVVQIGGAKLTPEVARRVRPVFGATLQQVFGMAEGLVNYTRLDDPDDVIIHTQGRPISPDDEIRIVDDDDVPVAALASGNLLTRGPYTIRAYHNAPAANARAFTEDGFYRTGDIVHLTAEGNFVVVGRATDQINRGGEKISGEEVEDHLAAHPQVFDAVVVSVPDRYLGERTCAFVVARGDRPRVADLRRWIRERGLAAYKVPDQVVFIDELPTTGVGKTSRKDLRAALQQLHAAQTASNAGDGRS